jgi:hypothetical protein
MTENERVSSVPGADHDGSWIWVRALQAAAFGIGAGLLLSLILSSVVLQGSATGVNEAPASECRRARPVRDAGTPPAAQPGDQSPGPRVVS